MKTVTLRVFSLGLLAVGLTVMLIPAGQAQTTRSEEYYYHRTTSPGYPQSQKLMIYDQNAMSEAYFFPPYQTAVDEKVNVTYYNSKADQVKIEVKNISSGQSYTYPMKRISSNDWYGAIPATDFSRNHELSITFVSYDQKGRTISSLSNTAFYDTLDLPEAYTRNDLKDSRVRIIPFQKTADSSPAFNVYWPGLYFSKEGPYPIAARVTSSRSPENSIRKLDPVPDKVGWYQFQVPTFWYSPGEEITVDFTTNQATAFSQRSDYPLESNKAFVPIETVKFKTLANQ